MLRRIFNRRWILTTLLVLLISIVFIRLGFWQLERLESRKASAAAILEQMNASTLILDSDAVHTDLETMEYRRVQVTGNYDPQGEVVLRNQVWVDDNAVHHNGVHLFTPLLIADSQTAVLVDRGWIPAEEASTESRSRYIEAGTVTIKGVLRTSQRESQIGMVKETTLAPGELRRDIWNFADIDAIEKQLAYPLLPVYIQEEPEGRDDILPYAVKAYPDTSQGAHLGFAFQWFALAGIVLIGYPILISRQPES